MTTRRHFLKKVLELTLLVTLIISAAFVLPPMHVTSSASLTSAVPARVIQGEGDFPRLPVVAPSADGKTMALYLVEGGKATQLLTFDGSTIDDKITCQPSKEAQYVACLINDSWRGASSIEVIDLSSAKRYVLDRGIGKLSKEKGAAREQITSVAWADDQHVLYTKVTWPDSRERDGLKLGDPLPIKSEVWSSGSDGKEKRLLATGSIYRVLGLSSDGQTLYVTRLIPGAEDWLMEGFALLDIASGNMENLWPKEETATPFFYGFQLIPMPDGAPRILFVDGGQAPGGTVLTKPSVIWMGNPESGRAEAIWTVDHSEIVAKKQTIYHIPNDILWSPRAEKEFIYSLPGTAWRVDLSIGKEEQLEQVDEHLLAWTPSGIVSQNRGIVHLLETATGMQKEIRLSEDRSQMSPEQVTVNVANWNVPYIHQLWDTADSFDGHWACGPTSAVMALAYYKRFAPHPMTVSSPSIHNSDYGWYVSNQYSVQSACLGAHTFDTARHDPQQNLFQGAYGSCTEEVWANNRWEAYGVAANIYQYAMNHDVGHWFQNTATQSDVQGDLRGGAIVLLANYLTPQGHIVVVRGYAEDGSYIVNDPFGNGADGSYDGAGVYYSWSQMNPTWYIALYGPQYLPDLRRHGSWDGNIIIQNGTPWTGGADVCLMNADGSQNGQPIIGPATAANSMTVYQLSSISGYLAGSAVVRPKQTAQTVVAENLRSSGGTASAATNYTGITPSGWGNPEWGQAATTVYVPIAKGNRYGYTTDLYIMNTGLEATTVTASFYDSVGTFSSSWNCYLAPGARCIGAPAVDGIFTAKITASQPVAAVAVERNADQSNTRVSSSNTLASGSTTIYLPLVKKKRYGNSTGVRIQNIGTGTANVTMTYYRTDTSDVYSSGVSISPGGSATVFEDTVLPDSFVGSARITSNQPIVGQVNESGVMQLMSTSAVAQGSKSVYLPRVCNTCYFGGVAFLSGIRIQNVGNASANVTIHYYSSTGEDWGTETISNLGAYRARNAASVPSGFTGSATVTADQPIVAVVTMTGSNTNLDLNMTYNAPNR